MKQSKTIYLIVILVITIIVLFIIQFFRGSSEPAQNNTQIQIFNPPPELKILTTTLSPEPIKVTDSITIKFDKPVNKVSLVLTVDPQTEIITFFDPSRTELTIEPANAWNFDKTYTITIFRATLSEDNQLLDKDYHFTFKTREYVGI